VKFLRGESDRTHRLHMKFLMMTLDGHQVRKTPFVRPAVDVVKRRDKKFETKRRTLRADQFLETRFVGDDDR
jgi:hypothetical protein